ncbi:Fe-S cluster assembly protein SufD [Candidiatus Paracoxiella cheracis]|uniref:Fe-S cluster assembly protein SufD n=1 Tax=Candidiatus Paracoxiella cheracis TaxID=3405120 RepID=UPI003BF5A5AE
MRESIVNQAWEFATLQAMQAANSANRHVEFTDWQHAQLQEFIKQGFPNRKVEDWKYTDVSAIAKQAFTLSHEVSSDVDIRPLKIESPHIIVFVNGRYAPVLSTVNNLPTAVTVSTVNQALQIPAQYQTPFSALNAALMTDGLYLSIPKNNYIEHPIHLIYLQTDDRQLMNHPRHFIDVGENSEVTFFEEYVGQTSAAYFNNVVTQISAAQNARVQHFKLQNEAKQAFHIANTIICQQKDSVVSTTTIATGASLSRDDLNYSLNEAGSQCRLLGLYHLDNERHIDNHSRIDHRVPHCSSEQNYKGIIDGKSRAVFNGRVIVHEDAIKTKALQSNQNLLLSAHAEIDAKPELEIYADDVQCAHGATVGRLDEQALFYLRSRGIDDDMAHHLLTCAFANEILEQIRQPAIAEKLNRHVVNQLAVKQCCGDCHHEKI